MSHEAEAITIETLLEQSAWVRALARHLVYERGAYEDTAQDAWVEALRRPPREGTDLRAWFAGMIRAFARQRRRSELRRVERERAVARGESQQASDGADFVAQAEIQQLVIRAVLELEEPVRTTLLQRYVHGSSAASIARAEGVPTSTVRNRLARGLARLRARLDSEYGGRERWWGVLLPFSSLGSRSGGAVAVASGPVLSIAIAAACLLCVALAWLALSRRPDRGTLGLASASATPAIAEIEDGFAPRATAAFATHRRPSPRALEQEPARDAKPRASLEGTVVDERDRPLAGVVVDLWSWWPGHEKRTDADGCFRFDGLEPDREFDAVFRKEGFCPRLFVTQQVGVKDWRITLFDHTWVEGRVTDAEGRPVPGARIRAKRGPKQKHDGILSEVWDETSSREDGRYRFYLEPDAYEILVRIPGRGAARVSNVVLFERDQRTLDLQLQPGADLRALVRDSRTGEPVAGLKLEEDSGTRTSGTSNEKGEICIEELFSGRMAFVAEAPGYARFWSEQCVSAYGRPPVPEAEDRYNRHRGDLDFSIQVGMEPVVIRAERAVRIEGVVVDPEERPVEGATIAIVLTGSRGGTPTGDTSYSVTSDAEGRYSIEFPAGGSARMNLVVHDGKYGPARRWANALSEPFTLEPGEVRRDLRLVLTRPGAIRGRVHDGEGQPLARQTVVCLPADGRGNTYFAPRAETGADGSFELALVAPGEHVVEPLPLWMLESRHAERATIVRVESDRTVDGVQLVVDQFAIGNSPRELSAAKAPREASSEAPREWNTKLRVGELAPDFELPAHDGSTVKLSALRGKPVLIDFWATWCPPCVEGLAVVEDATRGLRGAELHVVGVSFDTSREHVAGFLAQRPELDWKQICEGQGFDSEVARAYGVEAIPFVLLIDAEGRITHRALRGKALRESVQEVLGKRR